MSYKNGFFYFWSYLPFLCLNLISCLCNTNEYPIEYFDDAWYKCRTGRDDVLRARITTLAGFGGRGGGGGGGATFVVVVVVFF